MYLEFSCFVITRLHNSSTFSLIWVSANNNRLSLVTWIFSLLDSREEMVNINMQYYAFFLAHYNHLMLCNLIKPSTTLNESFILVFLNQKSIEVKRNNSDSYHSKWNAFRYEVVVGFLLFAHELGLTSALDFDDL